MPSGIVGGMFENSNSLRFPAEVAAVRPALRKAFSKEISRLVAKWSRPESGNSLADDVRAVAELALVKLWHEGILRPDAVGNFSPEMRGHAVNAMRKAVTREIVPMSRPLSASANTLTEYRKAQEKFERIHPGKDFTEADIETLMKQLNCSRAFAFRAKASRHRSISSSAENSPVAYLSDENWSHPADNLSKEESYRILHRALNGIADSKLDYLERMFGMNGHAPESLAAIARSKGISRQALEEQVNRVFKTLRAKLGENEVFSAAA